ncbi:unnamed protein product, partial [Callosobruchus maculatus]
VGFTFVCGISFGDRLCAIYLVRKSQVLVVAVSHNASRVQMIILYVYLVFPFSLRIHLL